ncbi:MAG: hypothetical protein HRU77_04650 [Gammaproteobacteria bacterium]|nr:MAG: hypothetical protein HRU77_04650 [Gammaproteobacteria bacterium]
MDLSAIVTLVFYLLPLALIVYEFSRTQRDPASEIQWMRRSIAMLVAAVLFLAIRAIADNSLREDLEARIQSSEAAIAGLQAMRQSQ